jgi:hypothetical protein
MATMLAMVQQAAGEMGLSVPTAVASSTSSDTVQQLALLNAVGYELQRKYLWEALNKEYRFTTSYLTTTGTVTSGSAIVTAIPTTAALAAGTWMVSGIGIPGDCYISSVDSSTQVTLNQAATISGTGVTLTFGKTKYALPSDFDRQIDRTHFDKSKRWEMLGPETPQQWQWLKSSYISTGPRIRYRILGGTFQIWPIVSTSEYLGFEYVSNAWAASVSGTAQTSFLADTDTCIFPDRLMVLGLKKKYFEIKGFDTTALTRDYEDELSIAKANDQGSPTLSMAPRVSSILIGFENIPDSNYGS